MFEVLEKSCHWNMELFTPFLVIFSMQGDCFIYLLTANIRCTAEMFITELCFDFCIGKTMGANTCIGIELLV